MVLQSNVQSGYGIFISLSSSFQAPGIGRCSFSMMLKVTPQSQVKFVIGKHLPVVQLLALVAPPAVAHLSPNVQEFPSCSVVFVDPTNDRSSNSYYNLCLTIFFLMNQLIPLMKPVLSGIALCLRAYKPHKHINWA